MTTSFSETHTTEELLPAESEEEKDDEEEEERAFQNRPYPPRIGRDPHTVHMKTHIIKSLLVVLVACKKIRYFSQASLVNDIFFPFCLNRTTVQ